MTRWQNRIAGLFVGGAITLAGASAAIAQGAACIDMQSQYLAAMRTTGTDGNSGQRMVQMEQLSRQLAQAQMAARQNGCNTFLFFGPRPSAQCPSIRASIEQLRQQIARARQGRNLTGVSPDYERERLRNWLSSYGCDIPTGSSSNRTLCVRACDGYYFPITFSASRSNLEKDAAVCQSVYTSAGEGELFYQPAGRDVSEARSLSNQRYGDQPYAFLFRQNFYPTCQDKLKDGIAALGERYLSTLPMVPAKEIVKLPGRGPAVVQAAMPWPTLRPLDRQEDPETIANRAGDLPIKPYVPRDSGEAMAFNGMRLVGAAYYAELFDQTKPPVEPVSHRPPLGFDLIGAAMAAETGSIAPAAGTTELR